MSAAGVQKLQKDLEETQRELREMKDRKMSLERECVIYQSQLEVRWFECRWVWVGGLVGVGRCGGWGGVGVGWLCDTNVGWK